MHLGALQGVCVRMRAKRRALPSATQTHRDSYSLLIGETAPSLPSNELFFFFLSLALSLLPVCTVPCVCVKQRPSSKAKQANERLCLCVCPWAVLAKRSCLSADAFLPDTKTKTSLLFFLTFKYFSFLGGSSFEG